MADAKSFAIAAAAAAVGVLAVGALLHLLQDTDAARYISRGYGG